METSGTAGSMETSATAGSVDTSGATGGVEHSGCSCHRIIRGMTLSWNTGVTTAVKPLAATADMEHPGTTGAAAGVELSWAIAVVKYLGTAATLEPSRALAVMEPSRAAAAVETSETAVDIEPSQGMEEE